jgi:hypothetical protein
LVENFEFFPNHALSKIRHTICFSPSENGMKLHNTMSVFVFIAEQFQAFLQASRRERRKGREGNDKEWNHRKNIEDATRKSVRNAQ